ncbi:hypothetical protein F4776DRAFT_599959 [Hypoxylon sp. NC0597]|nr:hypothetical protein F4776DRAFT_599959 [Hypoxylon sp. NC0597]
MQPSTLFSTLLVAIITGTTATPLLSEPIHAPRNELETRADAKSCLWCILVELNGDRNVRGIENVCLQNSCTSKPWYEYYVSRAITHSSSLFPDYQWKDYNLRRWEQLSALYDDAP